MPTVQEMSQATLLMWIVGFFFMALGCYSGIFHLQSRGIKKIVEKLGQDMVAVRQEIHDIDKRKVELLIYLDDKERAETILKTLQTTERCSLMQAVCVGSIRPQLDQISGALATVLENQKEYIGMKESMKAISERQISVISRIDRHMNGHE